MKNLTSSLLYLVLLFSGMNANAQSLLTWCAPASANSSTLMEVNNVRATINGNFQQFQSFGSNSTPIRPSVFGANIWLGAIDQAGNRISAAQTYQTRGTDFWPGPLSMSMPGQTSQSNCAAWDVIFIVLGTELNQQINAFNPANVPDNIKYWPGQGNTLVSQRYPLITNMNQPLAPFIDLNGNGIYEPLLGEYPSIDQNCLGQIPAKMTWYVFNDNGNLHTESNSVPMNIEVHYQTYAFASSVPAINNTIFAKYEVHNRRALSLDSTFTGMFLIKELGDSVDDNISFNTTNGTTVLYNTDNNDAMGYGLNPPAIMTKYLNKSINTGVAFDRGVNSTAFPSQSDEYIWYLRGRNRLGQIMGNNGITSVFSCPNPSTVNTQDRHAVVSFDNVYAVQLGDIITYDLAYSFLEEQGLDHLGNACLSVPYAATLQAFYDNLHANCLPLAVVSNITDASLVSISPNPTNELLNVTADENQLSEIKIIDILGKTVQIQANLFASQHILDVSSLAAGVYVLDITMIEGKRRVLKFVKE
jgi:Secretion system C-terminal sorting domain